MTKVDIMCPECRRWLAEVVGYGRAVCPHCGCEICYSSKDQRRQTRPIDTSNKPAVRSQASQ